MGNAVEEVVAGQDEEAAAMRNSFGAGPEGERTTTPTAEVLPADVVQDPAVSAPDGTPIAAAETGTPNNAVPVPEMAQLTTEQLTQLTGLLQAMPEIQASLEKVRRDTFGRIGGIEGLVKQIQSATPSGEAIALTPDDFIFDERSREAVVEDFPLVFKAIITGINKALSKGKVKGTAAPAAPITTPPVSEVTSQPESAATLDTPAKAEAEDEMEALREDWTSIVGPDPSLVPGVSPTPFRQWLAKQPDTYSRKILLTESPLILNAAIAKFEKETVPVVVPPPTPRDPRRSRLEAAVPLKGDGRAPAGQEELTEEQAMRAAYKRK